VALTMGDNDYAHDNMVVKANGAVMLSDVDAALGAFVVNTFNVTVSGGTLELEFSDAGGSDPTWVVNAMTISPAFSPPPSGCDRAQFIADVTVPDGTVFAPGASFSKTWRLKNVGTCAWTTSYSLVFDSGEKMGGPDSAFLPAYVPPGSTVDVTVSLTAPSTIGTYRGYWKFANAGGARFGIGSDGNRSWWVEIRTAGAPPPPPPPPPPSSTKFDFGTAGSDLAAGGYTRVTEATSYSGSFGWTSTSGLESRDRSGPADALKRDFVMNSSAARTFKVALANGTYAVALTMGDNDYAHDDMMVKANGTVMLPDVDAALGAFAVPTFNVTVSGGFLELEFSDAGGSDPTWVVNGLSITFLY
ncbi:MAG TPA: NBR1-Ig-like domain-containing protein, partial [Anaerolineales bacterium]|nr:NBR1-Ig-like domain-containing protein [Anaerolineales bacterium]